MGLFLKEQLTACKVKCCFDLAKVLCGILLDVFLWRLGYIT